MNGRRVLSDGLISGAPMPLPWLPGGEGEGQGGSSCAAGVPPVGRWFTARRPPSRPAIERAPPACRELLGLVDQGWGAAAVVDETAVYSVRSLLVAVVVSVLI